MPSESNLCFAEPKIPTKIRINRSYKMNKIRPKFRSQNRREWQNKNQALSRFMT